MRLALGLILCGALCGQSLPLGGIPVGGAPPSGPAYVNSGGDWSGGGSYTTGWSPTNGNTLIVWTIANDTTTTHTCSDGEGTGNAYTPDGVVTNGSNVVGRLFHAANVSGTGAYTITCTGTTPAVAVIEISGNRSLDTTSAGTNPSTCADSGTANSTCYPSAFTPSTAATILINGVGSPSAPAVTLTQHDSSYTTASSCQDGGSCFIGAIGYRAVSSAASYSDGWDFSVILNNVGINAAYK